MAFGGFSGSGLPVPKDIVGILVALFVTFSMQFFEGMAVVPALLRLTPAVFKGFVWQIFTYPFIGWGANGLWFLVELLILFWFGRDVFCALAGNDSGRSLLEPPSVPLWWRLWCSWSSRWPGPERPALRPSN